MVVRDDFMAGSGSPSASVAWMVTRSARPTASSNALSPALPRSMRRGSTAATARLERNSYRLIICDVMMADIDGFQMIPSFLGQPHLTCYQYLDNQHSDPCLTLAQSLAYSAFGERAPAHHRSP